MPEIALTVNNLSIPRRKSMGKANGPNVSLKEELTLILGECHVFLGDRGRGKTLLMETLALQREPPARADFLIRGENIRSLMGGFSGRRRLAELERDHIGYIAQHTRLLGCATVLRNIELGAGLVGNHREQIKSDAEYLGLGDCLRKLPAALDDEQRRLVAIARALAGAPSVIVGDDPTVGVGETVRKIGDPEPSRTLVWNALLKTADRSPGAPKSALVLALHTRSDFSRFCKILNNLPDQKRPVLRVWKVTPESRGDDGPVDWEQLSRIDPTNEKWISDVSEKL